MTRIATKYVNWKIFLDGIEVPWIDFQVGTGVDTPGAGGVSLEPDRILASIRPRTMVHIFAYNDLKEIEPGLSEEEELKERYELFWEGEVGGHSHTKTPSSRVFQLSLEGVLSVLDRHQMFMSGIGSIATSPLIAGSALLKTLNQKGLFSFAAGSELFTERRSSRGAYPDVEVKYRNEQDSNYATRIMQLITYFSSYNALFRMHVVRSRILNKIAGLSDRTLGYMIPYVLMNKYFKDSETFEEKETALGVLTRFNAKVFHHYVSMTGPVFPVQQPFPFDLVGEPGKDPKTGLYSIARTYYRNDYLIIPETYYGIPPSCNIIFPEFIRNLGALRNFSDEPTREVLVDKTSQSDLVVLSPDTIFRFEETPRQPADYWALTDTSLISEKPAMSPYQTPGDITLSLLGSTTDEEIEKGIITRYRSEDAHPMQLFKALANHMALKDDETGEQGDRVERLTKNRDELLPIVNQGSSEDTDDQAYIYIMKTIADFDRELTRLKRRVSLSLEGHRWLVPGFPMVICDRDISYIGWLRGHTFSVGSDGNESSMIDMDYLRPFPVPDAKEYEKIEKEADDLKQEVEDKSQDLKIEYDRIEAELEAAYKDFLKATSNVETRIPPSRDETVKLPVIGDPTEIYITLSVVARRFKAVLNETIRQPTPGGKQYLKESEGAKSEIRAAANQLALTDRAESSYTIDLPLGELGNFITSATRMRAVVKKYLESQRKAVDKVKEIGPSAVGLASTMGDARATRVRENALTSLEEFGKVWKSLEGYPYPPSFANLDLVAVEKAEEIYKDLLGAQDVFTRISEDKGITDPHKFSSDDVIDIQAHNRISYSKFIQFIRIMNTIFPILNPEAPEVPPGANTAEMLRSGGTSEWERESEKADSSASVRLWEEKNYLQRSNLMTFGEFLRTNGLALETHRSEGSVPTVFYQMVPIDKTEVTAEKCDLYKKLIWDNTIFSKIIDEWADAPREVDQITEEDLLRLKTPEFRIATVEVVGTSVSGTTKFKDADPEIKKLRESVKNPYLTTAARQERILQYARRHFGSRLFDGS